MAEVKVEPKVVHATCVVERSFSRSPDAVFHALSDVDKVRQWMGPSGGSALILFEFDFRDGGLQVVKYQMGPGTPIPGVVITNEVRFLSIVAGERIVTASTMKRDGSIFSASLVTFELLVNGKGTDLIVTHQGTFLEGSDGPAMREQGWNSLADRLVAVVTAGASTMAAG